MALGTPVAAVAAYSAAAGATSIAPAYPAGIAATDALILIVGEKPTAANGGTVTTPTGWTLRDQLTGAGGYGATIGADTGNTNLRIYTKDTVAGTETGTLAVTLAGVNVAWGFIVRVPTDGGVFSYGSADGQLNTAPTAGTAFAVALTNGTPATAFANGDLALWAMCIPTDVSTPGQFSAQSITATGATFSAATELNEPDNTIGNDIGGYSAWARVTAGSSAVAPTVTVTAGGTVTNVRGPIVLLRIRETIPPITGSLVTTESSADGFYSGAKAPILGAVSFTSTASPTSISVAYPAGISANDALVVFVAAKLTNSTSVNSAVNSLSVPAGWQYFVSSVTSAGVLAGLDVGDINVTILKKTATGSESGSLTINLVAGSTNVAWASIVRYPAPPSSAAVIVPYINTDSAAFRIGTQEETVSPLSFNVTFPEVVSENNSLFGTKDVFVYALAAASNAYGTNLFSKHTLLDNQNEPDFYTLRPGIQLSEFSTANQTHIAGAVAWSTVNSPETTLPFLGSSVSVELDRKYVSSELYVAYAGVKIRFVPFTIGTLSASETGSDTFAGRPPRPDLGTRTGSFAATESADRLTNVFGDSVNGYVTSPPVVGTVAYSATTTISPAYPAGIAANSIIVMFVAQKPSTANGGTITTPAGWTLQGESLAGGGYGTTLGIDTGNQNLWVFTKTAVTGTETGTVAVTLATTNSAWAAIASVQRSNSHPISFLPYAGESVTPSSLFYAVNAPTVANPGDRIDAKEGDIVLFAASIASDSGTPANFSNFAINDLSGFSLHTTLSELAEPDSAGGNDIGGLIGWTRCVFSQGFFDSAFEITADVVDATNSAGPTLVLRVRVEYPAATGNLAATETTDTFSGTGTASTGVSGNLAAAETTKDVSSFLGRVIVRGALVVTDNADALAVTGKLIVRGALAVAETGVDAASAIGKVRVNGALAAFESGVDVLASLGKVAVKGFSTAEETGVDTLISNGGAVSQGTFSVIEASHDAIAGSGSVLVQGDLEATEQGSDAAELSGVVLAAGTLVAQETGADAFEGVGAESTSGSAGIVEDLQDLLAGQGAVLVTGTAPIVEVLQDTLQADGVIPAVGTLSATEAESDTFAASGGKLASGDLSAVDEPDTASGSGRVIVTGYSVAYETGVDVGDGSGNVVVQGVASILDLVSDSAQAAGQILVRGIVAAVEPLADTMKGGIVIGFALSGRTQSRTEAQQSRPVDFDSSRDSIASTTRASGSRSRPAKNTASR